MARILIAEDDEPVRGFVKRALEMDGHAVVAAVDGAEALERLEQEAALSTCCSPTSGCRSWTASPWRWPPARLSETADPPDDRFADQRERAHDLEAIIEDVVTKPFSLAEIRAAVGRVLATGNRPVSPPESRAPP